MGAQLSLKAALPLAEKHATVSDRCSKTRPRASIQLNGKMYFLKVFKPSHWVITDEMIILFCILTCALAAVVAYYKSKQIFMNKIFQFKSCHNFFMAQ